MNNNIMSVAFASDSDTVLNELTIHRTSASLPFCGRYRFIDFTLSNLVNSGITTIGIITKNNYSSLMDHIRMGRDWDLNRKNSGIAIFPPYVSNTAKSVYRGKIDALYSNKDFLEHKKEEYVLLTNCNIAANIDYEDVFKFHIENNADITMLTYQAKTPSNRRVVVESKNNEVLELLVTDSVCEEVCEVGLNIYLIKKSLLLTIIDQAHKRGGVDFEHDVLQKLVKSKKLFTYKVNGYASIIDDIESYYRESMNMLNSEIRNDLYYKYGKIFTKVKDSVPTSYKTNAQVKNSLIADGCEINGLVENSILFRGVVVEEGAVVRNSIVMENSKIMKNSELHYTIIDKDCLIKESRKLSGYETYPVVIVKGKEV